MAGQTPRGIRRLVGTDPYNLTSATSAGDLAGMADEVDAAIGEVESQLWSHDSLAPGLSFDSVTALGAHPVIYTNHPAAPVAAAGWLEVLSDRNARRLQRFTTNAVDPEHWERTANLTGWNPWRKTDPWERTAVAAGVDVSTLTRPGQYPIAFTNQPGLPIEGVGGYLEVLTATGVRRLQRFTTNSNSPREWKRTANLTGWNPWIETVTVTGSGGAASDEGRLRVAAMRQRVGAVKVDTPAAVTIIMDHGLTNVKSKVLPLMRARGLTATLAINSGRWSDANNSGASQADVKGWLDVFEIANHGKNHTLNGGTGDADEIEGGRAELETQLGVPIDTYVQTGNTGTTYDFGDGNSWPAYWSTATGRVVTRSHAVWTGLVPNPGMSSGIYPLDGHPKWGAVGSWLDISTATPQARVTEAIATGGVGVLLRLHPQFLDTAGYITTAQLTTFLDWLVARRNADEVTVLTFRQWNVATPA